MTHFFDYFYICLGLLYVTILPGFVLIEYILPNISFWKKIPLYLVLSVIISTYFSYITSIIFGFNKTTLIIDALAFIILAIPKILRLSVKTSELTFHLPAWLISIIIYFTFFIPLAAGIFRFHEGYFVMSGPNWQDTAMHQSIIESLSEGNFPPVAPYFAGEKLSYYYFSDLHSAIVNRMFGHFFPWIIVILNPYFALTFFVAIYSLGFLITKKRIAAIISGLGAVYYGNLGFVDIFNDIYSKKEAYLELLKNNAYHINFDSGLQMVPMSDYFLQNRPMMVGLPVVAMVIFLLIDSSGSKSSFKKILLAGFLNASLMKFQFFGLVIGVIFFGGYLLNDLISNKLKFKKILLKALIFLIPSFLFVLASSFNRAGDRSMLKVVLDSFSWGPWQDHNVIWFLKFVLLNFNIAIIPFFISLVFLIVKYKIYKNIIHIIGFPLLLILIIPFVINFTIYSYDMFKFFYYFVPFVYIISTYYFFVVLKPNNLKRIFIIFMFMLTILLSSWTSVNMLIHAYINKTQGYSLGQYKVGLWIRNNTPQNSVFITSPTVHSPVSDIAGRLRILSYINWPHSHGFNTGQDNVFSRLDDINTFFKSASDEPSTSRIFNFYNIQYVYMGDEERSDFPNAQNELESNSLVKKIYDQDNIQIFERIK